MRLRLPTPFFDLLAVLVILFMIFLAPTPSPISTRDLNLPQAGAASTPAAYPLRVTPQRDADGWRYRADDGRLLTAGDVAAAAGKGAKVFVLTEAGWKLQEFLDATGPLRAVGVTPGLVVRAANSR